MSHFILPTLNAFIYCVIFMVVTVSCGLVYALFKWFCSDDEHEQTNHRESDREYEEDQGYRNNGITSVPLHGPVDDAAPQYEHIPMMPVHKAPSPRASPVPFSPYPTTTPYPSGSAAPYPINNHGSALPYPTANPAMPMPMPNPQ